MNTHNKSLPTKDSEDSRKWSRDTTADRNADHVDEETKHFQHDRSIDVSRKPRSSIRLTASVEQIRKLAVELNVLVFALNPQKR